MVVIMRELMGSNVQGLAGWLVVVVGTGWEWAGMTETGVVGTRGARQG